MSSATEGERPTQTSPAGVWLGRAWIAVVLIPVFFILAFVVGQVLYQCRLVKLGSALIVDSERTAMSSPNCGGRTRQDRILAF